MANSRNHGLHNVLAIGLVGAALTLTGCGGGGGGGSDSKTTTTTTTTAAYEAPGACSEAQLHHGCAYGFCNATNNTCQCMPNYGGSDGDCSKPTAQKKMTFYMYRMQDDRNFTWANDDLASLSGVTWYLHNEVVVQSCPRKFDITRVLRLKVTMFNTPKMFDVRKGMFGQFATFDSGFCHECMDEIFSKYGFVVGCETPGASEVYNYGGFLPIWYSLPGVCPSQPFNKKTKACEAREPGGQCDNPDGRDDCTWKYDYAGEVKIEELYDKGFDYKEFCAKGGKEYDVGIDAGVQLSFWNDKKNPQRNAQRVQHLREVFQAKYPDTPDLPEPWCDWAVQPPIASKGSELVV